MIICERESFVFVQIVVQIRADCWTDSCRLLDRFGQIRADSDRFVQIVGQIRVESFLLNRLGIFCQKDRSNGIAETISDDRHGL